MLELDHVTIAYGETQAVEDFSLHMEPGEIVSLVGESGSGKTSVIRGILGLLPGGGAVTQGNIVFDGKDLLDVRVAASCADARHRLRQRNLSVWGVRDGRRFTDGAVFYRGLLPADERAGEKNHSRVRRRHAQLAALSAVKGPGGERILSACSGGRVCRDLQ